MEKEMKTVAGRQEFYCVTPWSSEKRKSVPDFGGAYNRHIEPLPDDSWVLILDGDCAFTTNSWGLHIEEVIEKHMAMSLEDKGGVHLMGAKTNRLGGLHQCHEGVFSDNHDMKDHFQIGKSRWNKHGSEITELDMNPGGVAGLFMLFNKRVWQEVGGFPRFNLATDTWLNKIIKRRGGRLAMAEGIYLYHAYRPWKKGHADASNYRKHLLT